LATVVGDAAAHRNHQSIVLAVGVHAEARPLAMHSRGLILDGKQIDAGLRADDRRMSDFAWPNAHTIGIAIEDQRAVAVAGVVELVPTIMKPWIGIKVAFDPLHAMRRQLARDLCYIGRYQRRVPAAAENDVAVHDALGIRLSPVERSVITEVGAEIGHRG